MDGFLVILKFHLNFLVDEIEVKLDNLYDIASSLLFTQIFESMTGGRL